MPFVKGRKILLLAVLAVEGFLLLRPDGVLVRAARGHRPEAADSAHYWWRNSPVHMGCSIPSCTRPATQTASYHLTGPRSSTWRAFGFCDRHSPPAEVTGLVYRLGRPTSLDYEVPLAPIWAEVYFLLGTIGLGLWCVGMWRLAASAVNPLATACIMLVHAAVLLGLWTY